MSQDKSKNLQDTFLNSVRKTKTPLTIFLVNGVKLQGIVTWFDNFCVLLRRDGQSQLVYKHAISTIMPSAPVQLYEPDADGTDLRFRHPRACPEDPSFRFPALLNVVPMLVRTATVCAKAAMGPRDKPEDDGGWGGGRKQRQHTPLWLPI